MEEITTWIDSRMPEHEVRMLQPESDHFVWRIERNAAEAAPAFLKIPVDYIRSEKLSRKELTEALDRERLKARVMDADVESEIAFLLTRQTTGHVKELVLREADPPAGADRSVRQPPDAPGPVPR